jgi:hypothetical protein
MLFGVLKKVFSNTRYSLLALTITFLVLSFILLLPNREVIQQVLISNQVSLLDKLAFIGGLYKAIFINYSYLSIAYLFSIAILFGLNFALLTFYIRRRQTGKNNKVGQITSLSGLISGLFGIGCAACGSVIITSFLATVGGGGFILLLPFQGMEFGVLGVGLLLYSNYYLANKISDPKVCLI